MTPLILASRSPRRRLMLVEAGFDPIAIAPPYSDPPHPDEDAGGLDPAGAEALAIHLATLKAQSLADTGIFTQYPGALLLSADTICVSAEGLLIGQPSDLDHARSMILRFRDAVHDVVTGIALLSSTLEIETFADRARVTVGHIPNASIETYLQTNDWQGKAGGYNLGDRLAAGWPITVQGDPATVIGLPMQKLTPRLQKLLAPH